MVKVEWELDSRTRDRYRLRKSHNVDKARHEMKDLTQVGQWQRVCEFDSLENGLVARVNLNLGVAQPLALSLAFRNYVLGCALEQAVQRRGLCSRPRDHVGEIDIPLEARPFLI